MPIESMTIANTKEMQILILHKFLMCDESVLIGLNTLDRLVPCPRPNGDLAYHRNVHFNVLNCLTEG